MSGTLGGERPPRPSALTLSRIALGCGSFGGIGSAPEFFGAGLTEDQALAVMDAAWQLGLTPFDTADAYGGGRSEQADAPWVAPRGGRPRPATPALHPMPARGGRAPQPGRAARA